MARLTKDEIFAAAVPEDDVSIPEWGGEVLVRGFTKRQQQDIRRVSRVDGELDLDQFEMNMFLAAVVDPIFTEEDAGKLLETAAGGFERVMRKVSELNGATEGDVLAAQARFQDRLGAPVPVSPGEDVREDGGAADEGDLGG